MKNAFPRVGLESTTSDSLFSAHRAIHMRHGRLGPGKKLAGVYAIAIELLALCYFVLVLVGWLA